MGKYDWANQTGPYFEGSLKASRRNLLLGRSTLSLGETVLCLDTETPHLSPILHCVQSPRSAHLKLAVMDLRSGRGLIPNHFIVNSLGPFIKCHIECLFATAALEQSWGTASSKDSVTQVMIQRAWDWGEAYAREEAEHLRNDMV